MTIRVKITNEDTRQSAAIAVQQQTVDGKAMSGTIDKELGPGDAAELYVSNGTQLVVRELRQ